MLFVRLELTHYYKTHKHTHTQRYAPSNLLGLLYQRPRRFEGYVQYLSCSLVLCCSGTRPQKLLRICWSHSPNFCFTALNEPITTGPTVSFTACIFLQILSQPLIFFVDFFFFFWCVFSFFSDVVLSGDHYSYVCVVYWPTQCRVCRSGLSPMRSWYDHRCFCTFFQLPDDGGWYTPLLPAGFISLFSWPSLHLWSCL